MGILALKLPWRGYRAELIQANRHIFAPRESLTGRCLDRVMKVAFVASAVCPLSLRDPT
jgi:hypothetical protein